MFENVCSADCGRHTTHCRPCSRGVIICFFVGEQCPGLGQKLYLCCAARGRGRGRRDCRRCLAAEIYMEELRRLQVDLIIILFLCACGGGEAVQKLLFTYRYFPFPFL